MDGSNAVTSFEDVAIERINNTKCTDVLQLKTLLAQQQQQSQQSTLKIMLLNPWSINSMKKFGDFVSLLGYIDGNFDILALPESWICDSSKQIYQINGYNAIHSCRDDAGKGGIALFYQTTHRILSQDTFYEHQCNIVQTVIGLNEIEKFNIIAFYRPPGITSANSTKFIERLEQLLYLNDSKKCILMGDMNLDPSEDTLHVNRYLNLLESFSFKICNEHITREVSKRRLDHVCTNFYDKKQHAIFTCPLSKDDLLKSDHSIIATLIELSATRTQNHSETLTFLNHGKIERSLKRLLHPTQLTQFGDANAMGKYMIETICNEINRNRTTKQKTISKANACEWIDEHLLKLINKKDELKRKAKRSPTEQNEREFKKISKEVKKAKQMAQSKHNDDVFKNSSDSKTMWKNINQVLGRPKKSKTTIEKLTVDERTYTDTTEIANILNKHFSTVGARTADTISVRPYSDINYYNTLFYNYTTIQDEYTNHEEVIQIISRMKSGKSPGCDGITPGFLKRHKKSLATPITLLFNKCMENGTYPDILKTARIVPLYKGGSKTEVTNYRPISLLSTIGKVLEKLLFSRINKFVRTQKILYDNQYGFRQRCSTTIAATEMIQGIQRSLDSGKITCAVFLDVSKAFDTVKHDVLISKLSHYGIRGNTLNIIMDYLTNRRQYTSVNDVSSQPMALNYGVIQGGVLAALLFVLYINDIGMLKLHGTLFTYADDTAIVYEEYDRERIQQDLNKVADYFRLNVLSINASKTNYMIIKSPYAITPSPIVPLTINDTQIKLVVNTKYLGLHIDENLSWKHHIHTLAKEISRPIGIIHKLKYRLKKPTLKLVYHSLIHSKLSYMINVWGSAKKYVKKQLYTLQNRAVKIVHKLPILYPTTALYGTIAKDILPIEKIYRKSLLMFVQQCLLNGIHHKIKFEKINHRTTRSVSEEKLEVAHVRTERYGKDGIMYRACTFYNQLPMSIKIICNFQTFKKATHNHLNSI